MTLGLQIIYYLDRNMWSITCSVVYSQTNGPVADMPVFLKCISHPSPERIFTARTTLRGQIMSWKREAETTYHMLQGRSPLTEMHKTVWQIWFDIRGHYKNTSLPMLSTVLDLMTGERCNIRLSLGASTFKILQNWTRASESQLRLPVSIRSNPTSESGHGVIQNRNLLKPKLT